MRIFCRGEIWYANFQHQGKQCRQSLKTRSKKEARIRAMRLESDLRDGEFRCSSASPLIVEAVDDYLAVLKMDGRAKNTIDRYRIGVRPRVVVRERNVR